MFARPRGRGNRLRKGGYLRITRVASLLLRPASPDPGPDVRSGSRAAKVTADPWHISFTDAHGNPVLDEATGTGTGPTGTVGFQTAVGWFHATKVLDEKR